MNKLETRLKDAGYVFVKEQEVTFGLRSGPVKLYVKPGTSRKIYTSREEIVSADCISNKELKELKGYS